MLYDPARHEPLEHIPWDEAAALDTIEYIVRDTEERYAREARWPMHPLDADGGATDPVFNLYFGAGGVQWALHYLEAIGPVRLRRSYAGEVDVALVENRRWLRSEGLDDSALASYLMGDTGLLLLVYWLTSDPTCAARLEELIEANIDHPARELMWGSPGTMLAALFLHQRTREHRWAQLFVATARRLRTQLLWSPEHRCHYWSQDLYGRQVTYLDAVHGFVATAAVLIRGRHLFETSEWDEWHGRIVQTIRATAQREDGQVNWPALLLSPDRSSRPQKALMQFCHGAPGFVICLAELPGEALDEELLAAGEALWAAGPLVKGANLCHGTGGNGYALLKLYERTADARWLERARSFAMHAIRQTHQHARMYKQLRYSLWTGDLGLAIYLWHCTQGVGPFPTLETFFA